ncbi:MAG: lipoprotein-releasing ABC transporter ATP-binding protein LolD [Xanthomonadales bacterium]|jgi:lipoprotein-releasing system ATP-binding protein|nr:lipoprotein-releasing ABC transporter ATP-binding protein LolD [Xanthomonadales bacterium]
MNSAVTGKAPVLEARKVKKTYRQGPREVEVLESVDMTLQAGESLAIVGVSGAGKSTLLHILGGLDQPDGGEVLVNGEDLWALKAADRSRVRNGSMGFVYQFHHLLNEFSALENVAMPLLIRGVSASAARAQARAILDKVGLTERLNHKPGELSGGERQRAAVARALVGNPRVVLGDEPTGNLDERTADHVYGLMLDLNRELQTSLLLVTHSKSLASRMDRCLELQMGRLLEMG